MEKELLIDATDLCLKHQWQIILTHTCISLTNFGSSSDMCQALTLRRSYIVMSLIRAIRLNYYFHTGIF